MPETDLICFDDLDLNAAETQDAIAILEQDFYHRLIERAGSNPDDPDRGFGLLERLSDILDPNLAGDIKAEAKKDERIDHVDVVATETAPGIYRIDIEIQPSGALILEASIASNTVTRLA